MRIDDSDPIARRLAALALHEPIAQAALTRWRCGDCSRDEALMACVEWLAGERARLMRLAEQWYAVHGQPTMPVPDGAEGGESDGG